MGCPHIYYHRALQFLAYTIACEENNRKLAKELCEEINIEKLEQYILSKKEGMSDKEFYYAAGGATQAVIEEAYQEGTDPLNASIGGIDEFENFIGLEGNG
jgi:hypothetical protein